MARIEIKKIGWDAPKNIKAFITTRIGGASKNKYKFANLSLDVGDSKSAVMSNREEVQKTLNLPSEPSWMKQIHGTNIQYLNWQLLYFNLLIILIDVNYLVNLI